MNIVATLLLVLGIVFAAFVAMCFYVNRCVDKTVKPLAERVSVLEQERNDWKDKHEALAKLYENLQRLYDGLQTKYALLQEWAEGLAEIITQMGRDYPAPPSEIRDKRYKL